MLFVWHKLEVPLPQSLLDCLDIGVTWQDMELSLVQPHHRFIGQEEKFLTQAAAFRDCGSATNKSNVSNEFTLARL